MSAWKEVVLGELLEPVKTWNASRSGSDDLFNYIDLSAVDQTAKLIVGARELSCREAPSRARQLVAKGDVLVSTVRPNLNAVARVPEQLDGAIASTGFCVVRARPALLDDGYIFHWVKAPAFVSQMVRRATGASYPAVSDRIVLESRLPLPSLSAQRRIAGILDRAEALRAKRRAALAQLDTLTQAIFLELFGDPVSNSKGWPLTKLSQVGSLDRGVSKHRPRNAPELLGGSYPLVQTGEVANCDGYIRTHGSTYSDRGLQQSKLWPKGTLCVTIAANIAKTGILTFDACFPDSIVGFTAEDPATVEFVRTWLSFLQKALEENAPESAQKNINLALLRGLEIPVVPLSLQHDFTRRIAAVQKLKAAHRASLAEMDALFASLQHRAFRGEL